MEKYRVHLVRQGRRELGWSQAEAEAIAEVAVKAVMGPVRRIWLASTERAAYLGLVEWHRRWAMIPALAGLNRLIEETFSEVTQHLKGTVVGLPRTNNVRELAFRRYKWRYQQLQAFMSGPGADNFDELWGLHYNFERYQVRRDRQRRYPYGGKCPLELAGVQVGLVSWLDVVQV